MLYPLPVVMVSCGREGEKPNIITVAWAGTICSDPAMVSISVRKERFSHKIIKDTGEFVINLVNKRLIRATDFCGVASGRDVDKFEETRLTPLPSRYIKAPGIEESPLNLECRVVEVKALGSHDMFIANVVGVTIDNQYMDEKGKFNLNSSGLVSYSHGVYFELGKQLGTFGYSVKKTGGKKRSPAYIPKKQERASGGKDQAEADQGKKPVRGGKSRKPDEAAGQKKREYTAGSKKSEYAAGSKKSEYTAGSKKSEYTVGSKKSEYTAGSKKSEHTAGSKKRDYTAGPRKMDGPAKTGRRKK